MKRTILFLGLLFVASSLLAACSSTTQTQPEPSEGLTVSLQTDPETPVVGDVELQLDVKDENGQPLVGATVDVSADHIDMEGMTMSGLATEQEEGRYAITANFSMTGNWKLTVYIRKDSLDEKQEIDLVIK
jgi:hypothetical protein